MSKGIFLARSGKVFGPISQVDYDQLISSGKIEAYTWRWSEASNEWTPLDPAPEPLQVTGASKAAHKKVKVPPFSNKEILAICHDQRSVVSGKLGAMTDAGCELSSDSQSEAPLLARQSNVILNLLDPKTGKSVNVKGRLSDVRRDVSGWKYRIQWNYFPSLS